GIPGFAKILDGNAEEFAELRRIAPAVALTIARRQAVAERDPRSGRRRRKIVKPPARARPKEIKQDGQSQEGKQQQVPARDRHAHSTFRPNRAPNKFAK